MFGLILVGIPLVIFVLSIATKGKSNKDPILNAIVEVTKNPLETIAKESILKEEGDYAIYIKNFKTNEEYSYGENEIFNSASLYKLWVMAVAYQQISSGRLSKEEVLRGDLKKLDVVLEVASEEASLSPTPEKSEEEKKAEEEKNTISYSLDDAIYRMITISDNYAALLVASRAGNLNINSFVKTNFDQSSFGQPPKTSAKDVGMFYEMLYDGKLVSKSYSEEMIGILREQLLNDRIPKYLPATVEVAHKTGELGGNKHDAGIVFSQKGNYIIVVLSDTSNPQKAASEIAEFSKAVYEYFQSEK